MPPLLLRFPPVNYLTGATRSIDWPTNQPLDPAAIGAIADKHLRKTIRPTDLSQLFFRDAVDSKMVRHLTNWLPLCPLVETLTNNKNCHKNLVGRAKLADWRLRFARAGKTIHYSFIDLSSSSADSPARLGLVAVPRGN